MAILARLLEAGAMVAATTHYAELKAFATEHPGVSNAAVEFDVRTLRPTYRLTIGLPGKSQAFAIAERLGLAADILADARGRISAQHASMEETLAAIARAQEAQAEALAAAEREQAAAAAERELASGGVARARDEAARMLAEARRAADELVSRAEREVAELRREVTRVRNVSRGKASTPAPPAVDELARRTDRVRTETAEAARGAPAPGDAARSEPRVGSWARSRTLGSVGRVVEISGRTGRVTLETEGARLVLPGEDVEEASEPITGPPAPDPEADERRRKALQAISPTLSLRGERVEAALEQLEAYIDQALLAGLDSVAIVHGIGTGALRRAVREALEAHPRVRAIRGGRREEGGDGTTVAEL
jgi:DNA mismatch repair protein MutS2